MLDHGKARSQEVLGAAGAQEVLPESIGNGAHYMGSARMGTDHQRSVVNAWNQAHDVNNLFIVDGSSFTTAAGVNPTSTIGALALRCGRWDLGTKKRVELKVDFNQGPIPDKSFQKRSGRRQTEVPQTLYRMSR